MPEPATKQITTELSKRQVMLSVNQPIDVFEVTVYNDSDRFAAFHLKLVAAGAIKEDKKPWYRLTPAASAKIPAGDGTRFQVEVFDLPPIAQQFRGAVDLTVEVTSRELPNQSDRQPLRLLVEGLQGQPPNLSFLIPALEAYPGDRVTIVAQVSAPTRSPLEVTLQLAGLPDRWFAEGTQQTLSLLPGKPQKVSFDCEIPPPTAARSQVYPLRLEAIGRFPSITATGQLHVLPAGSMRFACEPLEQTIPATLGRWQNPTQGTAEFVLQFDNLSNLESGVQVTVEDLQPRRRWFWQQANLPDATKPVALPPGVSLAEIPAGLPIGLSATTLQIHKRLPWLGWGRSQRYRVQVAALESVIPIDPDSQTVQLQLFPVIPLWQQFLAGLLVLGLGALTWWLLNDPGHQAAVNSVQFSGQAAEVLSGSDDQTIRRWRVDSGLHPQVRIGDLNKAVRVVRYRPVNNDQVALGFENGEIQLANLLTGQRSRLTPDKDDRVFDLAFSRDARTLYSGHGSGLVLQWNTNGFSAEDLKPERAYETQFAIDAMTLVGDDDLLAIGGRNNRLLLLDLAQADAPEAKPDTAKQAAIAKKGTPVDKTATAIELTYPSGGSTDYISSLSRAEQQPNLLAVGDTKGQISLWDVAACLEKQGRCTATDSWVGQGGSAVRSVALTADGCFLASVGDDGQVRLWALDGQGARRPSVIEGRKLSRADKPLNAVDVIQIRQEVLVTSGGDDRQVRLDRLRLEGDRPRDRCPTLTGGGG
jgi:WD40 repeat protein